MIFHRPFRTLRLAVRLTMMTTLIVVVSSGIPVGFLAPQSAQAIAGSPGVPGTPTLLFTEDFEHNGSTTVDPPVLITAYTGATGQTYSASPYWSNSTACNGMILAPTSAPSVPPSTLCVGNQSVWNALKYLSGKLSKTFGDPGDQFTVASYTAGSGTASDILQLETNTPIALPAGGAYLTASIDTGAYNCGQGAPNYFMYLTDAAGVRHTVVSAGINPCTDPDAIKDNSVDGRTALLVRTVGDAPQLIDSTSVRIRVENLNTNGLGNDATIDNIQLLDVSPQLDKTFETPVPYGTTSTITFTVTNTYSPAGDGSLTQLDPKRGWGFADQLPAGLSIVGTPTTGSGSEACANFSPAGSTTTSVQATGDLSSGQAYCTVLVEVQAAAPGSYTNMATSVTTVGAMPPGDASVTFTADPAIALIKSATLNDINLDGVASVGDTISYGFVATNTGNVPLVNVAVTDPLVGAVTCSATTIPVGTSVACTANSQYAVTQTDVDAGQVDNTASVTGANSFNPATTVSAEDSATILLPAVPKLALVKTAGAAVDTNASGLVDAGDTIQYTFRVTNTGNVTVASIAISDNLVGPVTCTSTTLSPGAQTSCSANSPYVITEADETSGSVANTASVAGLDPKNNTVTAPTASTSSAVATPAPSLRIVKSADAPVDVNSSGLTDAGDTIRYRFVVTNTGNVPVSAVAVTDDLAGTVTCEATALAVGDSTNCVADSAYVIAEANEASGSVVNSAFATASDPDNGPVTSQTDSTTTAVATPAPSLRIVKSADAPVDVNSSGLTDAGDTIRYRFVVTNTGNVPLSAVAVTDDLAGAVTCAATSLGVGGSTNCVATAAYTITAADEAAGSVVNTAFATASDPDNGPVTSQTDSTTTAVATPAPSLVLDKIADAPVDVNASGLTDAGDTIQYRFVVTNNGNVPVNGITINDGLAGPATCTATVLAPGASTNCTANALYIITDANEAAGSVVNTAAVTGVDPDNAAVASKADSTSTAVATPAPSLVVDKIAAAPVDVNSSGLTDAGDTIQYRFVVTNNGNVPVSAIAIDDGLAGPATCAATTLAPGDNTNCTANALYSITEANETAGAVVNTATANGRDPDNGAVTSNQDTTNTAVTKPDPSLLFTKSAGVPVDVNRSTIVDAGDTIRYTFTVTNNGNVPITGIVVNDDRVGSVTCDATALAIGDSTNCSADAVYTVTEADETAGAAINTADVTGVDPDSQSVSSNADSTSTPVTTPNPVLTFTKTAGTPTDVNASGITDAGDTVQYRFVVTNDGNVPVTVVSVIDPLVGSVTCLVTTLAPGASTDCIADALYTVTTADQDRGSANNTASATGRDPDGAAVVSNPDSTSTAVTTPAPALELTKTAEPPVDVNLSGLTDAGDRIQFRFTVTNTGNVPVSEIMVDDPQVGSVTCEATTLAVGAVTNCAAASVYVVTEADEAAGEVVNTATAFGRSPDAVVVPSNTASTTTPATTPTPALSFAKSADAPIDVNSSGLTDAGDTIQYRFAVTNIGNVPISDIAVSDDLVASVSCEANVLGVGESTNCVADSVYTITEIDEAAAVVENIASASGLDPDNAAVASPIDDTLTPVSTPAPNLTIVKSADAPVDVNSSGLTDAGDTIQYRFVVTNSGNVPLTDIAVSDELVGPVTCVSTELAVGETTDCVADGVYVVAEADEQTGSIVNVATASGTDPDAGAVTSFADSTTTPVTVPRPSLVIDKAADEPVDVNSSGLTDAGDTIQYRFVVTNNGNVPLLGVGVADALAGAVTCEATTLAVGEATNCTADTLYVITDVDEANGAVTNTATAVGTDPDSDSVESAADSTTTAAAAPQPSLLFEKVAEAPVDVNESGLTDAGDTIQYTFTVTNNGDVPIAEVAVVDALAGPVTCEDLTLAVGETTRCVADEAYAITAEDVVAGEVFNTATATGLDPDGDEVISNSGTTTTAVATPKPSLAIDKSADAPVDVNSSGLTDAGDTIQYRFVVTNDGNVPIERVAVSDELAGPVTCEATTLAVGESTSCSADSPYVITEADEAEGAVYNTATGGGVDPDGTPVVSPADSTTNPVLRPEPSLLLEKFAAPAVDANSSGIVDAGDTIQYSFRVTNNGSVPISSVSVVDPLVGAVTCANTALAVGESTSCVAATVYTITTGDQAAGTVENSAEAVGLDPDRADVRSAADTTITAVVLPKPGVSLAKYAATSTGAISNGPFLEGDPVFFRFTVTNTGNVTLTNLVIDDPMIGATSCEQTTLAVGASTICSANSPHAVTAGDVDAGRITNTAEVYAAGAGATTGQTADASATVTTAQHPPLPATGANVRLLLIAGGALVFGGVGLLLLARYASRRRSAATA